MQRISKPSSGVAAALAAAVLAPTLAAAAPSSTLYGGGATLVGTAISGSSWSAVSPPLRGIVGDPGSLAGEYTASTEAKPFGFASGSSTRPEIFYCQTGSGRGKEVLNNVRPASNACGTYAETQDGFGAPAGRLANFAATDSPYSQTEFNTFLTNRGSTATQPMQIPFVAAVIAVIYNNPDTPANPITLTESKICRIFSGDITNWNQLGNFPSKPIKVVFRGDSSGTSFAFSNHLSAVCPGAQPTGVSGFKTTQTFGGTCTGSGAPLTCGGGSASAWPSGAAPAGSIGAPGNGAVSTVVSQTDGAIGFADVADTNARITADPSLSLQFALVQLRPGTNPATGKQYKKWNPLNHPRTFTLNNVLTDTVVSGIDANGRPNKVAISPAAPVPGCMLLADPDGYATSVLDAKNDYRTYPLVGVSYLAAAVTGNQANTFNLRQWFVTPFGFGDPGTISDTVTTVGAGAGYMYVRGVGNVKDFLTNCIRR
jgi:ABC-type phosphate transport system substrate-binding protein